MKSWKTLSEFPDEFELAIDSQDVNAICDYYGIDNSNFEITGAIAENGEYTQENVWLCTDNAPYKLTAIYEHVSCFVETKLYESYNDFLNLKFMPFGAME